MKKRVVSLLLALCMVFVIAQPAMAYSQVGYGSRGNDVKTMQTMLNTVQNANLKVDGIFGSASLAAVKSYQKSKRLSADGICGKKTWAALEADYNAILKANSSQSATPTTTKHAQVQNGSTGADVKTLQTYLNKLINAGLTVDGIFGSKTTTAVKNYQRSRGLSVDGICGKNTWAKLEAEMNSGGTSTPVASTLKIGSGNYNPRTLIQHSTYSISGTVTSNYRITEVTVGIYDSQGNATSSVRTVNPNSYSYNIYGVDKYIKFGILAAGSYTFKVTAKDDSMSRAISLVSNTFKVQGTWDSNECVVPPLAAIMASNTWERQTGSGATDGKSGLCVLTCYSILLKNKLYLAGKSYSEVSKNLIYQYNDEVVSAYWGKICNKVNANYGTNLTHMYMSTFRNRNQYSDNTTAISNLLKTHPEGVLAFFTGSGKRSHAVVIVDYEKSTDTFMVMEPGMDNGTYMKMQSSIIGSRFGSTTSAMMSHIEHISYFA